MNISKSDIFSSISKWIEFANFLSNFNELANINWNAAF